MTTTVSKPQQRHNGTWIWLLLVAFVAYIQWPALKELYHQVAGTEFPKQTIQWQHELANALQLANQSEKPILVVFGASWCPPCRSMKREVWPNPQVSAAVSAACIPVYVDVDDRTQAEIVSQYQVSSIPTVLLLDANGVILRRESTMSVAETLGFLTGGAKAS